MAAALRTLGKLPYPLIYGIGHAMGTLLWLIPNDMRRVTRINIETCFPDKPRSWQNRLVRHSLQQTAITACEMGAVWSKPVAASLDRIHGVEGVELLESALNDGKGVVVLAPHLGNWEVLGIYLASRFPITNLYQPPAQQAMHQLIHAARTRQGSKLAPTTRRGVIQIVKALRNGEVTGILPDQEPDRGSGGEFVPFFGKKALTGTLIPKLASEGNAVAIGGFCLREKGGYRVIFRPVHEGIRSSDLKTAAACMNRSIEHYIMECPEQYQWEYKRFKRRPRGEEKLYNPGRIQR